MKLDYDGDCWLTKNQAKDDSLLDQGIEKHSLNNIKKEHINMNMMDIATALDTFTPIDLEQLAKHLDYKTSDNLYRILWMSYVKEDVRHLLNQLEIDISDDDWEGFIEVCASRYVYNGDYDCTLSYWNNLENIIRDEMR